MSRITRDQFVESFSDGDADAWLTNTPELEGKLERLGIRAESLRQVAGEDGAIDTREELGHLFDLIDTLDHDGSRRSIATSHVTADGREEATASGAALAALSKDLGDARTAARLGGPGTPAASAGAANDEIFKDLSRFEGNKSFMYLDTNGYVTTGIGHLVKDEAAAQKLPWINSATGQPATKAEISAAFERVASMPKGKNADAYKVRGGLVLPEGNAAELARSRLDTEFLPGLRKLYPGFDSFPPKAQRALVDMAYNLGLGKLAKFHHLGDAVKKEDWTAAAAACHRRTSHEDRREVRREDRNDWTRDMFLGAADAGSKVRSGALLS